MIDLKDFVSNTLISIVSGVEAAQEAASVNGSTINPLTSAFAKMATSDQTDCLRRQPILSVKFDVAVGASQGSGTGGAIRIVAWPLTVGSEGKSEKESTYASRVQFEVPIQYRPVEPKPISRAAPAK